MMIKKVTLRDDKEYITLSQLLKIEGFVSSGGEVRFFLENNKVIVNERAEMRRGKKLYTGDQITIAETVIEIVGA